MRSIPRHIAAIVLFALLSSSLAPMHLRAQSTPAAQPDTPAPPPPAHPITPEQLAQLLQVSHTREIMRVALRSASASQQNAGIIPQAFFDDMAAEFDKIDFAALMLPAYQRSISQEDAQAALDFYRTPAGKRFIDASPVLVAETQKAASAQGQEIALRLIAKYKDQIEANARAAGEKKQQESPH